MSLRSHYSVTTLGKPFEPSRIVDKRYTIKKDHQKQYSQHSEHQPVMAFNDKRKRSKAGSVILPAFLMKNSDKKLNN